MTQLKVKGITKYLEDKEMRLRTLFKITQEGKGFYVYNDKLVTPDTFYKMFPMELSSINYKGSNPDKTKI